MAKGTHSGGLSHLSPDDKETIIYEIAFFLSDKGFIEGCALLERFSSVLSQDLDNDIKARISQARKARKKW